MILYSLTCTKGHSFDEWFSNSAEYDSRKSAADLCCPDCGDKEITKAIMAPNVGRTAPEPAPRCSPQACSSCAFAGQH